MPNYQYRCKACGREFLRFQSISDEPLTVCPECGGELLRLLSGGGGVIYKGAGFYVNDYKKQAEKPAAKDKKETKDKTSEAS
ncbi:MAG: FmdB family zinc ribbon protein [Candidatus Marinimicrobia bacterium]|nr:FmdB family zinc ribbon protein [Candidatus Neomarinimicrobiota bacterium]